MRKRTDALIAAGIPAEFHLYRHASHGFDTGRGTDAGAGWTTLSASGKNTCPQTAGKRLSRMHSRTPRKD